MPGLDRTGPEGRGSQTGRGMGKCNTRKQYTDENSTSDNRSKALGKGLRQRRRGGENQV